MNPKPAAKYNIHVPPGHEEWAWEGWFATDDRREAFEMLRQYRTGVVPAILRAGWGENARILAVYGLYRSRESAEATIKAPR